MRVIGANCPKSDDPYAVLLAKSTQFLTSVEPVAKEPKSPNRQRFDNPSRFQRDLVRVGSP